MGLNSLYTFDNDTGSDEANRKIRVQIGLSAV
jgi:hypothetical protein